MPVQTRLGVGVVVGVPDLHRHVAEFSWSLVMLQQPINYVVSWYRVPEGVQPLLVDERRNLICEHALSIKSRYILFLDCDVCPPPNTLLRFAHLMDNHQDWAVLTGVYVSKVDPPSPLLFKGNGQGAFVDFTLGDLVEITGCGMGLTMIRTEILKKMAKPWFKTTREVTPDGLVSGTEDLYFCKKLLDNLSECKIMADTSVIAGHWDINANPPRAYWLSEDSIPVQRMYKAKGLLEGQKLKILDIACGETQNRFPEGKTIRVDIRPEVKPDFVCDVTELPFPHGEFDMIYASHILEHFDREENGRVFDEWMRVLKDGGEVRVIVPDVDWALEKLRENPVDRDALNVLYGAQTNPYDYHKYGFNEKSMKLFLTEHNVEVKSVGRVSYNLVIIGKKLPSKATDRRDVAMEKRESSDVKQIVDGEVKSVSEELVSKG